MCKEVISGDSFEIDANFGLRFMPTIFPIQNRIRADLHFFYVRNRNLWKNWTDFFGNTWSKPTALVAPYIGPKTAQSDFFSEGSLSDYLGVPTSSVTSVGGERVDPIKAYHPSSPGTNVSYMVDDQQDLRPNYGKMLKYFRLPLKSDGKPGFTVGQSWTQWTAPKDDLIFVLSNQSMKHTISKNHASLVKLVASTGSNCVVPTDAHTSSVHFLNYKNGAWYCIGSSFITASNYYVKTIHGPKLWDDFMKTIDPEKTFIGIFVSSQSNGFAPLLDYFNANQENSKYIDVTGYGISCYFSGYNYDYGNSSDANATFNPNYLPISALPYRAYESIFNAFYRNERIDPMLDENGYPEYNKYLQNDGDGEDNFDYKLHNRYWEKDFLTTALPSPQMGNAPLIGLAQNNRAFIEQTMTLKPGVGTQEPYSVKIMSDPDTKDVIGISYYSENIPLGSIEALNEAITFGISINDFRNVNALQRWLEKSQARGYKYRDQLLSHFGVEVKFEQLNMPEFIGGVSQDINSQTIVNQAASENYKLGEFAGTLSAFGNGQNKIRKYCDEPGFIVAILSISPIPTYSQLLPKMFLKHHRLDYYFPEFGHIGLQPISLKEIVPLQVHRLAPGKKDDTFGYQRSFYDYVQSTDEVHGSLRTSLRNYLINREFADLPALTKQFIEIDPEEVNDIFAVTEDTHKVVGQVSFKITAKRPIPFFGTPTL
nr:MAG: major capsid protein [Microviridae sp.]